MRLQWTHQHYWWLVRNVIKKAFRTIKKEIEGRERQEDTNKHIKDMVQRFDALNTKVENNIKKLNNIESLNQIIMQAPNKIKETFAEIASMNVPTTGVDRGAIKDSLKEAIKESKKEDNKGCSIIMYNVPEQETKDIEERNTQEFQCVDDFITKGIKIGSLNIKHVNRMGRYVKERKDKPRPMRVTFTEKNSLLRIFRNISNLKEAEEKYHRISIQRETVKRRNGGIP